jgi:ABC-2 type transport system permease protein
MFLSLVENELLKILRRKRFRVVFLILASLLVLITFAVVRTREKERKSAGAGDWHVRVEQRVVEMENWIRRGRLPDEARRRVRSEIARLQYYLDHDRNPDDISGPLFARTFAELSSYLLLPLCVIVFASDLVSGEFTDGTIKPLLTRPVRRWKILASKLVALLLCVTLMVAGAAILAWLISGVPFGHGGWNDPVYGGFRFQNGELDFASVRTLPVWKDALMMYGLAWFSELVVACVSFLLSVLLRSTAAAMGTMIATLTAGTILPRVASGWDAAKYLFVTNLPLPSYYSGSPPPIEGMTLSFSVVNLLLWGVAAAAIAFAVFTRRDVLS